MATAVQIRDKTASRLGIVGEGETIPSYEADDLDKAYKEIFAQLQAKNLNVWDFDEEVPDEYVYHVVAMTAYVRLDEYAVPNARYKRIARDNAFAIPEIRELRTANIYTTPQPDYF